MEAEASEAASETGCCCAIRILPTVRCGGTQHLRTTLTDILCQNPQCKCTQLFLSDPISYRCPTITAADKATVRQYCQLHDKTFYVHCPLIANLAKPEASRSVNVLTKNLQAVRDLPGACVLHVGKVGTLANVAARINELDRQGILVRGTHARVPFHLLLEIAAGQGTELGRTWEEMRHLYEALDTTKVGLCVDTQHAYASGMCQFRDHEDVVTLFDEAQSITHKGISMLHLNDSARPCGSRVDRHEVLRKGHIWYREDDSLRSLLTMSHDMGLDLISETSDPGADMQLVKRYIWDM